MARFVAGMLLFALAMEALMQLLPVQSRMQLAANDRLFPVMRMMPEQNYVYSFGWDFLNVTRGRTNNVGMFNSADYVKRTAAVAIVGDSYIEARMLPYAATLQGHLEKKLAARGIGVFAASASGAGLADYASFAQMLHREVSPQELVILLSEGDLLEALAAPEPGYRGMRCEAGHVALYGLPYHRTPPTLLRKIFRASALLRYVEINLKTEVWLQSEFNRPTASKATNEPLNSACLSDYLHQLTMQADLDPAHILFVVDGLRGKYSAQNDVALWHQARQAREAFMTQARDLGFPVIDMQPVFTRVRQVERLRVDFNPRDNHWNGLAHQLAADAVEREIRSMRERSRRTD